jgi:hypothetical protein
MVYMYTQQICLLHSTREQDSTHTVTQTVSYKLREIHINTNFSLFWAFIYYTFMVKLYTIVVFRCGDVVWEQILGSTHGNCLVCILLQLQIGDSTVILILGKICIYMNLSQFVWDCLSYCVGTVLSFFWQYLWPFYFPKPDFLCVCVYSENMCVYVMVYMYTQQICLLHSIREQDSTHTVTQTVSYKLREIHINTSKLQFVNQR